MANGGPSRGSGFTTGNRAHERKNPMKRLLILGAAAVIAAAPAVTGLVGNASFAQSVPVHVPAGARIIDDHGRQVEPGDDRGRHAEPGDDRGRQVEPGDDRGRHAEPGDDRGSDSPRSDDGGSGHGGQDDGSGHR
jgi:hypothetical protein